MRSGARAPFRGTTVSSAAAVAIAVLLVAPVAQPGTALLEADGPAAADPVPRTRAAVDGTTRDGSSDADRADTPGTLGAGGTDGGSATTDGPVDARPPVGPVDPLDELAGADRRVAAELLGDVFGVDADDVEGRAALLAAAAPDGALDHRRALLTDDGGGDADPLLALAATWPTDVAAAPAADPLPPQLVARLAERLGVDAPAAAEALRPALGALPGAPADTLLLQGGPLLGPAQPLGHDPAPDAAGVDVPDRSVPTTHLTCPLPHPPIRITEDTGPEGFVLVGGTPTYRPGSGVVAGSGTADDPYVIEGWCIDGDGWEDTPGVPDEADGILIQETSAHVVVRNVQVRANAGAGIHVQYASNVTVEANRVGPNGDGGILVLEGDDVRIVGNTLERMWDSAVGVIFSSGVRVEGNLVEGADEGVVVIRSPGTAVVNNIVQDARRGVFVWSSDGLSVGGNTVEGARYGAAFVSFSDDVDVRGNTFRGGSGDGMFLSRSDGADLADNVIEDAGEAIVLHSSEQARLSGNTMIGGGIVLEGFRRTHRLHAIDDTNIVNGEPVHHIHGQDGVTISEPAGQVIVVDASNVTLDGLVLDRAGVGVQAAFSENVTLQDVEMSDNAVAGGTFYQVQDLRLDHVTAARNGRAGLIVEGPFDRPPIGVVPVPHAAASSVGEPTGHETSDWPDPRPATIHDTAVLDNSWVGLDLSGSYGAKVAGLTAAGNGLAGVALWSSDEVHLEDSVLADNRLGVLLSRSTEATLTGNTFEENGLYVFGRDLDDHLHSVDATNTVDGDPLVYLRDESGATVPTDAGQVFVVNSSAVNVGAVEIATGATGVHVAFSRDVEIAGARLSDNIANVLVDSSRNVTVRDAFLTEGGIGARVHDSQNVTVRDSIVAANREGVWARNSQTMTVRDSSVASNEFGGVVLFRGGDNAVTGNAVTGNGYEGVAAWRSPGNTLADNVVADNGVGVLLLSSPATHLTGNRLDRDGVGLASWDPADYVQAIDATNTVNGDPLVYVRDQTGGTVGPDAGQVLVVNSTDVLVQEVSVDEVEVGVHVAFSRNVTVQGGGAIDGLAGVLVERSNGTTVRNGWFSSAEVAGVVALHAEATAVEASILYRNRYGVLDADSVATEVAESYLYDNEDAGVAGWFSRGTTVAANEVQLSRYGVLLYFSDGAVLRNNELVGNGDGAVLTYSDGATIEANVIAYNDDGVDLYRSESAVLRSNDFRNNEWAALSADFLDQPVDAVGNWWGHPTGPDAGTQDDCTNTVSAGLGDAIRTYEAGVCFTPWRLTEAPGAGPQG